MKLISLDTHTHRIKCNSYLSLDTTLVENNLYNIALFQKLGNIGPFYNYLLKNGLKSSIGLKTYK